MGQDISYQDFITQISKEGDMSMDYLKEIYVDSGDNIKAEKENSVKVNVEV